MPLPCMPGKARRNAGLMQEPVQIWRPASPRSGRLKASGTRERHDLDHLAQPYALAGRWRMPSDYLPDLGSEGRSGTTAASIPPCPPGHSMHAFEVITMGEAAARPSKHRKLGQMASGPTVSSTARARERNPFS